MQGRKVTAPIARSTAYDFNAQLAPSHLKNCRDVGEDAIPCANHPEVRDVMEHEILFTFRKPSIRDSRMRGMTSLNGVDLPSEVYSNVNSVLRNAASEQSLVVPCAFSKTMSSADRSKLAAFLQNNRQLRDLVSDVLTSYFEYVGIALTPCSSGSATALQRQGFSATRGGLMTVMNTGLDTIYAGQKVRMVIDIVDVLRRERSVNEMIDGVPRQKILARLQPVKSTYSGNHSNISTAKKAVHSQLPVAIGTPLVPSMQNYAYMNLQEAYANIDASTV